MEFDDFMMQEQDAPLAPPQAELAEGEVFEPLAEGDADPYARADEASMVAVQEGYAAAAQAKAAKPASERIADLLGQMHSDRKALLAIVDLATKPATEEAIAQKVAQVTAGKRSVYSSVTLCHLLEEAGAISKVDANGDPFSEEALEPKKVVIDGVEYLEQPEPQVLHWLATADGAAAIEADKPLARLEALFETKTELLPIFKRVLMLCCAEGGAKTSAINAAVDNDPLVQKPRFFASYFTEQLEKCDCIEWASKAWHTTDNGMEALVTLEGVEDDWQPATA